MAIKGASAKAEIMEKILNTFEGSFKSDKEIRIPVVENGENLEIKVTLTTAQTNIGKATATSTPTSDAATPAVSATAPTPDEKAAVAKALAKLGL